MAKRIVTMVTAALMAAALMAPAALAVDKQCTFRPCQGTDERDTLYERGGDGVRDTIRGREARDLIFADLFGADRDVLYGGPGFDVCYVDESDGHRGCEEVALAIE